MKYPIIGSLACLLTICLAIPTKAENIEDTRQLLSQKNCPLCDLNDVGLAMTNLAGANLKGASLVHANLSRCDLSQANLSYAKLSSASLYGANLIGANLRGADLRGVDLREAYLFNADLTGALTDNAVLKGASGIPANVVKAEDFLVWGMQEARKKNNNAALDYFNQSLTVNPAFAPAYLARSMTLAQTGNYPIAIEDAQKASTLFTAQGNPEGAKAAQQVIKEVKAAQNPGGKSSGFLNTLGSIAGLLLQFLL